MLTSILMVSKFTKLSFCMIFSLIQTESNGRFITKMDKGSLSYGYVQIKCDTARMFNKQLDCNSLNSEHVNILYGAYYLKHQLKRYRSQDHAIMAYNSGTYRKGLNDKYAKKFNYYLNRCKQQRKHYE